MTPDVLLTIRARLDKAVAGPYTVQHERRTTPGSHGVETSMSTIRDADGCWICEIPGDVLTAELLAAARTDVGALLDEVERLTDIIKAVQAAFTSAPTQLGGHVADEARIIVAKLRDQARAEREETRAPRVISCPVCGCTEVPQTKEVSDLLAERDAALESERKARSERDEAQDGALVEVARLIAIINRAHTSAVAMSAQCQAAEEENDRLTSEIERLRAERLAEVALQTARIKERDELRQAGALSDDDVQQSQKYAHLGLDPDTCQRLADEIAKRRALDLSATDRADLAVARDMAGAAIAILDRFIGGRS